MGLDMYLEKKKKDSRFSFEFINAMDNEFYDLDYKGQNQDFNELREKLKILFKDILYTYPNKYKWEIEQKPTMTTFFKEIARWRKANMIHKWFIDKCASGIDNCKRFKVSKDQIYDLFLDCCKVFELLPKEKFKKMCEDVNAFYDENSDKLPYDELEKGLKQFTTQIDFSLYAKQASEILPTKSGFFFGSTDYDFWYFEEIKNTITILDKVLSETDWEHEDVVYCANW